MSHRHSLRKQHEQRRASNALALTAFGTAHAPMDDDQPRLVEDGDGPVVFTIGYERRSVEEFFGALVSAGVKTLVDVRERPLSRKPGFSRKKLEQACFDNGIAYVSNSRWGSTASQRERLKETGDFSVFKSRFRSLMKRSRVEEIHALLEIANQSTIAMMCYERLHCECHRSVLATLLAEAGDAKIVAIE